MSTQVLKVPAGGGFAAESPGNLYLCSAALTVKNFYFYPVEISLAAACHHCRLSLHCTVQVHVSKTCPLGAGRVWLDPLPASPPEIHPLPLVSSIFHVLNSLNSVSPIYLSNIIAVLCHKFQGQMVLYGSMCNKVFILKVFIYLKDSCQLGKGKGLVKCTYRELALRFFSV